MDSFDVTADELRLELERLGYHDVSEDQIRQMQEDIRKLAVHERSKNSSMSTNSSYMNHGQEDTTRDPYSSRVPLYDTNSAAYNRPISQFNYEHEKLGKENQHESKADQSKEPSLSTKHYHTVYVPSASLPEAEYSLYTDGEHQRGTRHLQVIPPRETRFDLVPRAIDNDTTLETSSQTSETRQIKRKVLRKRDGKTHICDESVTTESEDTDDLSDLRSRLQRLPLRSSDDNDYHTYRDRNNRPLSAKSEPSYRMPDNYEGPKALIRPMTAHPHKRNLKKSDPVSKWQSYEEGWKTQLAPGEKAHKGLRWNVREQMLYHDTVVEKKQHKVFQPNSYKVPTEKQRKALRWQVRNDMAQGIVPPSQYS